MTYRLATFTHTGRMEDWINARTTHGAQLTRIDAATAGESNEMDVIYLATLSAPDEACWARIEAKIKHEDTP